MVIVVHAARTWAKVGDSRAAKGRIGDPAPGRGGGTAAATTYGAAPQSPALPTMPCSLSAKKLSKV